MNKDASDQFCDDAPKSNPWQHDALGFAPFAKRVAKTLVTLNAPNGYVLGLHGEWGSGKTTVLNFIEQYFKKWREEDQPEMADFGWLWFKPWIVSGHQDLVAAFFKVLSENIADGEEKKGRTRKWLSRASDGIGDIVDAAAALGARIDHTNGLASKVVASIFKGCLKGARAMWLEEPSIQATYEKLVERLEASGKRFVVFVDDIDRLTSAEICTLMQMVKTVGLLPNVTYCLSYDRQIVWDALKELAPGNDGHSGYAEKIVQHEIEMPEPSRVGLMRMLEGRLTDMSFDLTGKRWRLMLKFGLYHWIRHPRDVGRLANAVQFTWGALRNEVDPHDVLCMEGMRLFNRNVFNLLRDNQYLLVDEDCYGYLIRKHKEERFQDILNNIMGEYRGDVMSILRILFPQRSDVISKSPNPFTEGWSHVVARRGIATKAGCSAYFSLARSPDAVPKHLIDQAAAVHVTREQHREFIADAISLKDIQGNSLLGEYFRELFHRVESLDSLSLSPLLQALIDQWVLVQDVDKEDNYPDCVRGLEYLVGQIMEALKPEDTANILRVVFSVIDNAESVVCLYFYMAMMSGKINYGSRGGVILNYVEEEFFNEIGCLLLAKIESLEAEDKLTSFSKYAATADVWAYLGGVDRPRAWLVREATRNGHALAKITYGLVRRVSDETEIRSCLYNGLDLELYDLDALEAGCKAFVDAEDLTPIERARIKALQDELPKLRLLESSRKSS